MNKPQSVNAEQAIGAIAPGSTVFIGESCGEPQTLVDALVNDRERLKGTRLLESRRIPGSRYARLYDYFRIVSFHVNPDIRELIRTGKADFLPLRLSEMPTLFRSGRLPIDAALVQIAPPDGEGHCSFGVSVGYTMDAALSARMIIAEINQRMPRTCGPNRVPLSRFDYIVESSRPLLEYPYPQVGEVEAAIARNVGQLVDDGSVLCLGIGAIPEALVTSLQGKRDLGIHSGMVTDGLVDAVNRGIITNERKSIDRGKSVAGMAMGTTRLFEFINENPRVELHPFSYTHDIKRIAQIDNFVCITSAIEVDLTGQVNAESMGSVQLSTVGGQADFIEGAALSRGGKSIIALSSTARNGEISKIVRQFEPGTIVTAPRHNVRYVITEYGTADLWGKALSERRKALIQIAHPKFRDWLEQADK